MPLKTLALAAAAAVLLAFHAGSGWVPLLDSANLAFHEAGHPLFGFVSERLAVYGGTLMQLLMPAACWWQLRREQQYYGSALAAIWFAENLLNVARYMADARAHQLPLVGGLDPEYAHDWTFILRNWGLLRYDTLLADLVRFMALALIGFVLWRAWQHERTMQAAA